VSWNGGRCSPGLGAPRVNALVGLVKPSPLYGSGEVSLSRESFEIDS